MEPFDPDPTKPKPPEVPLGTDFITTPGGGGGGRTSEEKEKAMLSHLGVFVPVLAAFLILRANGRQSQFIRGHATEALNFQLTMLVPLVLGIVLTLTLVGACVGLPIIAATVLVAVGLSAVAAMKASDGQSYRYPVSLRLMR